ncbi:MAG: hypothetical protein ACTSPV_00740 [Candidatus Hodarchaeales archaeon]
MDLKKIEKVRQLVRSWKKGDIGDEGIQDGKSFRISKHENLVKVVWDGEYEVTGEKRLTVRDVTKKTKTCQRCGKEFVPSKFTPYQKYCPDCIKSAPKPDYEEVVCSECGEIWKRSKFIPYIILCPKCRKLKK